MKKDIWQDYKSKDGSKWGSGNDWGKRYKSSYKPYRRRHSGKKGKRLLAIATVAVLVLVLFQFDVFSWDSVKSIGSKITGTYESAVSWSKDKVGLEDSGDTTLALPVTSGVVVEEYGLVINDEGEENYHSGIDIQVPDGSEILAAAAGEVIGREEREDGTIWLTLKHDENWSTVYGRLGESERQIGDQVAQGDVLGKPKSQILHFEVLEKDKNKNPVSYFK